MSLRFCHTPKRKNCHYTHTHTRFSEFLVCICKQYISWTNYYTKCQFSGMRFLVFCAKLLYSITVGSSLFVLKLIKNCIYWCSQVQLHKCVHNRVKLVYYIFQRYMHLSITTHKELLIFNLNTPKFISLFT